MTAARNSVTGTPRAAQCLAGVVPRSQMLRECVVRVAEAAQVDDARHAGRSSGISKGARRAHVAVVEVAPGAEAVHKVVGDVDVRQSRDQRGGGEDIARHDLHMLGPGASLQAPGITNHATHRVAPGQQLRHEPAADVAVGAGDQDAHQGFDACRGLDGSAPAEVLARNVVAGVASARAQPRGRPWPLDAGA